MLNAEFFFKKTHHEISEVETFFGILPAYNLASLAMIVGRTSSSRGTEYSLVCRCMFSSSLCLSRQKKLHYDRLVLDNSLYLFIQKSVTKSKPGKGASASVIILIKASDRNLCTL